jgi:hypothetical protein
VSGVSMDFEVASFLFMFYCIAYMAKMRPAKDFFRPLLQNFIKVKVIMVRVRNGDVLVQVLYIKECQVRKSVTNNQSLHTKL